MAAGASYRTAGLPVRGTNPLWNSDLLDLSDGRWAAFLVYGPARAAIAAGFNGVFLDTLDSVETNATGAVLTAQRRRWWRWYSGCGRRFRRRRFW